MHIGLRQQDMPDRACQDRATHRMSTSCISVNQTVGNGERLLLRPYAILWMWTFLARRYDYIQLLN